jgi:polyketide synthase PksJ
MSTIDIYDIAITGMSGEFPGASNIAQFWQNLLAGQESIQQLTQEQLQEAGVLEDEQAHQNYMPFAGTLSDIDLFAADFFGFSPRDASLLDPQHRKLFEHTWHALEDANINTARYPGTIGVFVGSSLNTYLLNNILSQPNIKNAEDLQQILLGNGQDYLATRIAYLMNLRGTALNIQTACSTSLVAVHQACQHLLSHQVDVAVAGGVSIAVPQNKGYLYSVDGMLSVDGHCRPFSDEPGGTIFSSGLGVIILKRYADAVTDGDSIYSVIKSSAVNNDGHQKVGFTAPSVAGQAEVITLAHTLANVQPEEISFLEAHGTATGLGDLIELSALQKVFSKQDKKQFCALGSVKSNIGHLDVAAGIAGLIKTVMALKTKKIPATLHCAVPTTKIDWSDSAFFVNQKALDWQQQHKRYAGVSSFGIGGTNAHVVLSEVFEKKVTLRTNSPALLVFSAKTPIELKKLIENCSEFCCQHPDLSIHSLARTLQEGRMEFNYRAALVVNSWSDIMSGFDTDDCTFTVCEQELIPIVPKAFEDCSVADLEQLQEQWLSGHVIQWQLHYQRCQPQKIHLPVYPFTKNHYWIEPNRDDVHDNKRLATSEWFYAPSWRKSIFGNANIATKDKVLLVFLRKNCVTAEWLSSLSPATTVITVIPGSEFKKFDSHSFSINYECPESYHELLTHLLVDNIKPSYCLHALSFTKRWEETSQETFDLHQNFGLLSILCFIKAWEKIGQDLPLKLTVLTNRLNQVSNEVPLEPHKAPLLSAIKVIPKEYIQIQTQLLDLDFMDHPQCISYQMAQLKLEIFKQHYDQEEVIYRGTQRWLRDYVSVPIAASVRQPQVRAIDKVILITGGLGQLGLDIAEYFSQNFACKIALFARTRLPHESEWTEQLAALELDHPVSVILQRIIAMKNKGTAVEVFCGDVGDSNSFANAIQNIEDNLGKITGIVHAAGETINGIISLKTVESLQESYRAKVYGTYNLYKQFQQQDLDFFILCSSMNALIGGLGQLDNTAANAFIDYMSDYINLESGNNVFAINWGAVNSSRPPKVNVLHQFMDLSTEHKKNNMTDDEINQIYDRLLSTRPGSRIVISPIAIDNVLKNWNRVSSVVELTKDRPSYVRNQERVLDETEQPQSSLQQWVSQCWQQLLGLNVVGLQDNFFVLGGHSLAAMQFIAKVKEEYQIKTHVMNLYELPTLQAFSDFLANKIKNQTQLRSVIN